MTKAPTPTEKSKKQHDNTKRHQNHRLHKERNNSYLKLRGPYPIMIMSTPYLYYLLLLY